MIRVRTTDRAGTSVPAVPRTCTTRSIDPAINPIDSSRCSATSQGLRLVSTVMPPMTPWNGMPKASTTAMRRAVMDVPDHRHTATSVPMATATKT